MDSVLLFIKRVLFPGVDIGTRKRMKFTRYFKHGDILTLDAGCGNGAFCFAAHKRGNRVIGIDFDKNKIGRCVRFQKYIGINQSRCQFKVLNIHDLETMGKHFDQIICFETLEHLANDTEVIKLFSNILKPKGLLHLCTPRRDRTLYYGERLSEKEDGGHIRLGYTLEDFERLLHEQDFVIIKSDTTVGKISMIILNILQWISLSKVTCAFHTREKDALSMICLFLLYPFTVFDAFFPNSYLNIYVCAQKID